MISIRIRLASLIKDMNLSKSQVIKLTDFVKQENEQLAECEKFFKQYKEAVGDYEDEVDELEEQLAEAQGRIAELEGIQADSIKELDEKWNCNCLTDESLGRTECECIGNPANALRRNALQRKEIPPS